MEDVILRIYRQSSKNNEREERREEAKEQEKKGKKEIGGKRGYSNRYNLADDCDEVFFFFFFCQLLISNFFFKSIDCSYYEGEGLLSTSGCETVDVTDEYVDCRFFFNFFFPTDKHLTIQK